jgi:ribosomal protein L37AE/L43A
LKPGSYGKACSAKVCTKCQKNLVEKADANSKEKICDSCKAQAEGGGDAPEAPM